MSDREPSTCDACHYINSTFDSSRLGALVTAQPSLFLLRLLPISFTLARDHGQLETGRSSPWSNASRLRLQCDPLRCDDPPNPRLFCYQFQVLVVSSDFLSCCFPPRDPLWMRLYVRRNIDSGEGADDTQILSIFVLDTMNTFFIFAFLYTSLIVHFDDLPYLRNATWGKPNSAFYFECANLLLS